MEVKVAIKGGDGGNLGLYNHTFTNNLFQTPSTTNPSNRTISANSTIKQTDIFTITDEYAGLCENLSIRPKYSISQPSGGDYTKVQTEEKAIVYAFDTSNGCSKNSSPTGTTPVYFYASLNGNMQSDAGYVSVSGSYNITANQKIEFYHKKANNTETITICNASKSYTIPTSQIANVNYNLPIENNSVERQWITLNAGDEIRLITNIVVSAAIWWTNNYATTYWNKLYFGTSDWDINISKVIY